MGYVGEAKREYQRRWLAARRQRAIEYLGGSCALCGADENLEFDHIDRSTKTAAVSHILSRSWDVIKSELDKCQLLCYTHHAEKTMREMPEWKGVARHGTHSKYSMGCRCGECREAHSQLAKKTRNSGRKW